MTCLSVQEFHYISPNKDLPIQRNYHYIDARYFDELEHFILENQNLTSDMPFFKLTTRRGVGKVVQAQNFVGTIQLSPNFQIEILPKIHGTSGIEETKKCLIRMLNSMADIPHQIFNQANNSAEEMPLLEIYIMSYLRVVSPIIKRGLIRTYLQSVENQKFFKGKLLVTEQIRYNHSRKERFFVETEEYSSNISENKLLKSSLNYLLSLTTSRKNKIKIKQFLAVFDKIQESQNYKADFQAICYNRQNSHYKKALGMARVFLEEKGFASFNGETGVKAVLFPMEKLFESFVSKELEKLIIRDHLAIKSQESKYRLFDDPDHFKLRPDIVVYDNQKQPVAVLDAKWKKLLNNPRKNYGISQADMYQMFAYAHQYQVQTVIVLYPLTEEMMAYRETGLQFGSHVKGDAFTFTLYIQFVDVNDPTNLLIETRNTILNKKYLFENDSL